MRERENRLQDLHAARAEANRLLWVATDPHMHEQLEVALRELDDAGAWLANPEAEENRSILELITSAIRLARLRMAIIDRALVTRDIDRLFPGWPERSPRTPS
jgi:hypothetical protein